MKNKFVTDRGFFAFFCLACIALGMAGCAKEVNKASMNDQELKTTTASLLREKKYEEAANHLEQFIAKYPEDPRIGRCRLSLANCFFKLEQYPAARQIYEYYHQHYPADKYAEYAKYRSVQAQHKQTLSADRDQTPTITTMQCCSEYLHNLVYKKYRHEVQAIHQDCLNKLIEKEIYVYNFYLHRGKTKAAEKRLAFLKENYLGKDATLEPRLLYLEYKLAHQQNNPTIMQKTFDGLSSKYPESPYVAMVRALENPKPFVF